MFKKWCFNYISLNECNSGTFQNLPILSHLKNASTTPTTMPSSGVCFVYEVVEVLSDKVVIIFKSILVPTPHGSF